MEYGYVAISDKDSIVSLFSNHMQRTYNSLLRTTNEYTSIFEYLCCWTLSVSKGEVLTGPDYQFSQGFKWKDLQKTGHFTMLSLVNIFRANITRFSKCLKRDCLKKSGLKSNGFSRVS
jgi:hypothetical protein